MDRRNLIGEVVESTGRRPLGQGAGFICNVCDARFAVRQGGGFFFDLLHCDACGAARSVTHKELGDTHLRFVKGLGRPYAIARAEMDRRIQAEYPGEPIDRAEYHALAEATLDPCSCGGRFKYDAPARCPNCRSTSEHWSQDPNARSMHYD